MSADGSVRHIVWDWNGTLLADNDLAHAAFNASLSAAGLPPMDAVETRALYRRPLQGFYEEVFARKIPPEEWLTIDEVFQAAYQQGLDEVELAAGAQEVLDAIRAAGWTQSLLSMSRHDVLLDASARWGVDHHFDLIQGHRGIPGATKQALLLEHWEALDRRFAYTSAELVIVGDTHDDADAAAAVGAACILVDSGTQTAEVLRRTGNPVVPDLAAVLPAVAALRR